MVQRYIILNIKNLVELSVDVLGNNFLTSQGFNEETVNKIKETPNTRNRGTATYK